MKYPPCLRFNDRISFVEFRFSFHFFGERFCATARPEPPDPIAAERRRCIDPCFMSKAEPILYGDHGPVCRAGKCCGNKKVYTGLISGCFAQQIGFCIPDRCGRCAAQPAEDCIIIVCPGIHNTVLRIFKRNIVALFTCIKGKLQDLHAGKATVFQQLPNFRRQISKVFCDNRNVREGFLDGINESLKVENPIEELEDTTEVSLEYDPEKLYKNMVDAKADWLYNLEEWDNLLTPERRKELYKEQKLSGTVIKEKKVGRNDPCPCGSGKKYKYCCGR